MCGPAMEAFGAVFLTGTGGYDTIALEKGKSEKERGAEHAAQTTQTDRDRLCGAGSRLCCGSASAAGLPGAQTVFRGKGELVLSRVLLVDGGKETDVTGRVDGALLTSSLRLMKTDFFPRKVQSLDSDQIRYALDGTCGGRPFHIVLGDGEQSYLYESADQGMYAIWDSGAWMALLDALTGEDA